MTPRTNGPRPLNRTCKECRRKIPRLPHSRSKQTLHKFGCEKTWPRRYLARDPRRNWREGTKQKIASLLRRIKDLCPTPDYILSAKNKWNSHILGRVVYLSYRPLQVIQVYAHNILHRHRAATDLFCCRRDSCKQIEVGPRSLPTQFCKCIGRRHHAMSATTAMLQSLVPCLCDLTGTRQVSFSEFFVVH